MTRPRPWVGAFAQLDRPEPLDELLGDPADPGNPTGNAAFLAADEDGDLLFEAERALDRFGLGHAFVPRDRGGWLTDCAELGRSLRPLFRRDVAVALGHGASNLVGAVNVWATGSDAQQTWLAGVLTRNGRVAAAYTDLDSGNDVGRSGLVARPTAGGYVLHGTKDVINNVARAEAITLLARTGTETTARDHSLLLLPRAQLPAAHVSWSPRVRTSAVRAMYLGGIGFADCPVPTGWRVGREGEALETMLRTFQVTRSVLMSGALGSADSQLRTVAEFTRERILYRHRVSDFPHARRVLARAFADLLLCDAFASVVCRALHLAPRHTCVLAPALKYAAPVILGEAIDELGTVLGARSFLREGPHASFQKHLRDLPVAAMVHGGEAVCLATMIPLLPRIAQPGAADIDQEAELCLFRLEETLEPFDWTALAVYPARSEPLIDQLAQAPEAAAGLAEVLATLSGEAARVRHLARDLPARDRGLRAPASSFEVARRHALLSAAGAAVGVWRAATCGPAPDHIRDPAWLAVALRGVCRRLGLDPHDNHAGRAAEATLAEEVLRRVEHRRTLDLAGRALTSDS